MLNNIPRERALLYMLLIGLLPILFALFHVYSQNNEVSDLRMTAADMEQTALIREKKQAANMTVRHHYRDVDHFYIDKYLETLTFLEPEIESLQKVLNNKNIADDEAVKKRLEYLSGSGNSLAFSEGIVQSTPIFQETTETLVHPVEVNVADLQKILARIEGLEIGPYGPGPNPPQLIILDLKLDRKPVSESNEVFLLNLKLLKREYP